MDNFENGTPQEPEIIPAAPQNNGGDANNGKGKAIASLVLGIIAVVFAWFGYGAIVSIVLGIVGIILGIQAKKSMPEGQTGMATAGLVLSIIGLVLSVIMFVACVACVGCIGAAGMLDSINY